MLTATAVTAIIGFIIWLVKRWLLSSEEKRTSQSEQERIGQEEIREVLAKEDNEKDINHLLDNKLRSIDRLQNERQANRNP